ncbi:hypothetical protein CPB83DRAFT_872460 [Crepidotus variabilis]|uniref:Uncharacterized protein n=1 Tax=Crepidotus variabilis TaxID=179855 RepID=A0A9P6ET05_9AGAR|nr:hypothetical protein CPB83DRAFT_872460 [Crepidotus variabilis]
MKFGSSILLVIASLAVSLGAAAAAVLESRDWIGDIINQIGLGLVTDLNAYITTQTLVDNKISIDVNLKSPLIIELTIDRIVSSAGLNGTIYSTFDHTFEKPVVLPPQKKVNTGRIPDVLLTQGALASLDIIQYGIMDLYSTDVYVRALTIDGNLGVPITIKGLKQLAVPANYTLELS